MNYLPTFTITGFSRLVLKTGKVAATQAQLLFDINWIFKLGSKNRKSRTTQAQAF